MKIAKLSDIHGIINKIAPPGLAEPWDNSGLQLGDPSADVSRIMVALDATPAVVDSAIASACQLLVTHHPLIFKPQKTISAATPLGRLIHAAIRGGLAIISSHTSYDIADGGLNDLLAERLGLSGCAPLQVTSRQELAKLVVFVPEGHLDLVRTALFPHAEQLGAYSGCSFAAGGEGTFTPLAGAAPFIGSVGTPERVEERRLELLVSRPNLPRAVKALLAAHPYEEPAFDIYPLLNEGASLGLGRIGRLAHPAPLADFAALVAERLHAPGLRYVGDPAAEVSKVALCSGSGASLLREALRAGAECLVTGDVKYHDAREAEDLGIALIDAGHFPSEHIMVAGVAGRLREMLAGAGYTGCEVFECRVEREPFRYCRPE
ncbi:MAG: Nif3-like dinuclear metal center hexameric protein [Deltaproteobacteria bacterium]|nr:Nif3-like dinuclear metal center hexameric protein [Deltaproteobacteria bacterium]